MMALLGISHVERNGHHYYRGLSMLPPTGRSRRSPRMATCIGVTSRVFPRCGSRLDAGPGPVNAAPFGVSPAFDPSVFERWIWRSTYQVASGFSRKAAAAGHSRALHASFQPEVGSHGQ